MSEDHKPEPGQQPAGEADSGKQGGDQGMGYPQYLLALFQRPDDMLDGKARGLKLFGLINLVVLVALIALSSFVQRVALPTTSGVQFSWLLNGIKFGLAFAIPIAIALFAFQWYARREGQERSLDFFIEKFGGAMALPVVLVALAIPLNLLGVTMHSWFRASGLFFIYIAVFMMSYLFVAPQRIKVAVVFTLAFYFAYRLIWLLM
jgi:hypothetical protein